MGFTKLLKFNPSTGNLTINPFSDSRRFPARVLSPRRFPLVFSLPVGHGSASYVEEADEGQSQREHEGEEEI